MKFWLLTALILIGIIPFVLKADLTKKLLFSNKSYAKQIEVKTYVLTQEQVAQLFKEPNKDPIQLTVNELGKATRETKKRYFVVRARNLGDLHAWGILSCKVRYIREPLKIPMISIRDQFCDYIICVTGFIISPQDDSPYPDISYEWSELYTK
ncbi:MAG: hypothetical protein K940chlam5_01359 [Candidatus Anoxychlamydiales bacterium]|nr:hypothetical protein [Candidatus Anoxychlamydiales bacterium]